MPPAPPQLEHALGKALESWPRWQPAPGEKPVVVDRLAGGLTNSAWLIRADTGLGVLRLNSPWDSELNIDRERERHIHSRVAEFGLAPQLWYCDPGYRFLVTEFIEGRVWDESDFADTGKRGALFELMAQLHAIEWHLPRFDYWLHLRHYQGCVDDLGIAVPEPLQYALESHDDDIHEFQMAPWQPCLVHHDLEPANIIEGNGRLVIVDWEYAGLGYRDMDFPDFPIETPAETAWDDSVVPIMARLINDYWFLLRQQLGDPPP